MDRDAGRGALAALVWVHLAVAIAHGLAHRGAEVSLAPAAMAFVVAVILVGPVAGLLVMRRRPAAGASIVAATMAGALVFGVVNHFAVPGPDHVAHVAPSWRLLFATTAALLAATEAAGAALGAVTARRLASARAPE
jgi:hypothetical protein